MQEARGGGQATLRPRVIHAEVKVSQYENKRQKQERNGCPKVNGFDGMSSMLRGHGNMYGRAQPNGMEWIP